MKTLIIKITYCFLLAFLVIGCQKEEIEELGNSQTDVQKANIILKGDIVLSTEAKMAGVSKTLLPEGCPTKFSFEWLDSEEKLLVRLPKFHVGNMPFAVAFQAKVTYSKVSYFKKDEYPPEDGWLQFKAENGVTFGYQIGVTEPPVPEGNSLIEGFINVNTQEVELLINYNMMNVVSHCYKQKIDKKRIGNYDEEFKQYEEDLKKYKEDHGLN